METKRIYNLERSTVEPECVVKFKHTFVQLPTKVDLRDKLPKVYNQGALGSCTAQALSAAYEYLSNVNSPIRINSKMAWLRPLTPNF